MMLIIKTLLHYEIKPVIVSVPEYDYNDVLDNMNIIGKGQNIAAAYINNSGNLYCVKSFRKELLKSLAREQLQDSISIVDYGLVCETFDDCPELYENSMHLSGLGNIKLGGVIAKQLLKTMDEEGVGYNLLWTGL